MHFAQIRKRHEKNVSFFYFIAFLWHYSFAFLLCDLRVFYNLFTLGNPGKRFMQKSIKTSVACIKITINAQQLRPKRAAFDPSGVVHPPNRRALTL